MGRCDELLRVGVRGAVELRVHEVDFFELLLQALHLTLIVFDGWTVGSNTEIGMRVKTPIEQGTCSKTSVACHDALLLDVGDRGRLYWDHP